MWNKAIQPNNDKIKRIVVMMCAIVSRLLRFILGKQCDGNFVHTFARRLHPAGIGRF